MDAISLFQETIGSLPVKQAGNLLLREAAKTKPKIAVWYDRLMASDLESDFNLVLAQTCAEMGEAEPQYKALYQKMTETHELRQEWIKIVFVQETDYEQIIGQKIGLEAQKHNVLLRFAQRLRKNLYGKISFQKLFAQQEFFEILGRIDLNLEKIALFSELYVNFWEQNNQQNQEIIEILRQIAQNTAQQKNTTEENKMTDYKSTRKEIESGTFYLFFSQWQDRFDTDPALTQFRLEFEILRKSVPPPNSTILQSDQYKQQVLVFLAKLERFF